ncbi:hypothetical protein AB0I61_28955 [Polymorphospora rubra]|uniref:hypothetical protein n=1 Tax=Polymorphospora rubra TaxID=338584 RepID=UPI003407A11B
MRYGGKLTPEQFRRMIDDQQREIARHLPALPLYGLDGWTGLRFVGECGLDDDVPRSIGLAHGRPGGPGPYVQVVTTRAGVAAAALERRRAVALARERPMSAEVFDRVDAALRAEVPEAVTIVVDGAPREFTRWRHDGGWIAEAVLGDHPVVVEATGVGPDAVRLTRVRDFGPYLDGRRAFLDGVVGDG